MRFFGRPAWQPPDATGLQVTTAVNVLPIPIGYGSPRVHAELAAKGIHVDRKRVPTWAGFLYLAVVLDAFGRRIVGWAMATTLATQLVLDALDMALVMRRPSGVIHHSDQGSQLGFNQYTSIEFGKRCRMAT